MIVPPILPLLSGISASRLAYRLLILAWAMVPLVDSQYNSASAAEPPETETANPPDPRQIASSAVLVDFNRDIRPILSNRCLACHGPDEETIESELRLDTREHALTPAASGSPAIDLEAPDHSELLRRVMTTDESERMPPSSLGNSLTSDEIQLLKRWIEQGAHYAKHWSFAPLSEVAPPVIADTEIRHSALSFRDWSSSPIDAFIASKLIEKGWHPNPSAERHILLRRVYLDLTGLPPTPEQIEEFKLDDAPDAYERRVDELLASPAFGEHWGRKWLDLARYADSAGYADDPLRTIWGYRDWVVQAMNQGMPFDQFTREQLAGDLLPNCTPEQLVATAFHRNTMTNNEGGTNDEEFRNAAVVDRVNTTFSVWLGLTMACAQCHTHKYDPIPHEEYFQLFAIFNQSQDEDRRDETPVLDWYTPQQRQHKQAIENELSKTIEQLEAPLPHAAKEYKDWAERFAPEIAWDSPPIQTKHEGNAVTLSWGVENLEQLNALQAIRMEFRPNAAQPKNKNSDEPVPSPSDPSITNVRLTLAPTAPSVLEARYLRIEVPGRERMVSLSEVEVFSRGENIATSGRASQSSTGFGGEAMRAIDGNRNGNYNQNSVTHTEVSDSPWWELDLLSSHPINKITIWNRTDGNLQSRLNGAVVTLLDADKRPVMKQVVAEAPTEISIPVSPNQPIPLSLAKANHAKPGSPASNAIDENPNSGWQIGSNSESIYTIEFQTSIPKSLADLPEAKRSNTRQTTTSPSPKEELLGGEFFPARLSLELTFDRFHTELPFRLAALTSVDPRFKERASIPPDLLALLTEATNRQFDLEEEISNTANGEEVATGTLQRYFTSEISAHNHELRQKRERLRAELQTSKPRTSVPIMRDLDAPNRRKTFVQLRGNYREHGLEVQAKLPSFLHQYQQSSSGELNRLDLAQWILQSDNPLTPRVIANRYWEELFGIGIVSTSEDFGSQSNLPTHPELLDYLAGQLLRDDWDTKAFIRSIVLSNAYRQSSATTPESFENDPDNAFLSRGPRFRPPAEVIRDSTLAVSGLLSRTMLGPPVRPQQPNLGLSAAFGSKTDWETSKGEDRYRRSIYTQWRRSSPYASLSTFDAPNREVCVLKRDRTNTPLQALVTLNDPSYVEAAQMLARRIILYEQPDAPFETQLARAFQITLSRKPTAAEVTALNDLYSESLMELQSAPENARELATNPLGPIPDESELPNKSADDRIIELAAWTTLCNVLLNLDEFLVKL